MTIATVRLIELRSLLPITIAGIRYANLCVISSWLGADRQFILLLP